MSLRNHFKSANRSSKLLSTPLVNGLRVVAPLLILGYVLNIIITPVHKLLGSLTLWVGSSIGLGHGICASPFSSLLLGLLLLFAIGCVETSPPGRMALALIDRLLCKLPFYKSVRKLVKLPGRTPKGQDPGAHKYKGAVWVWQNGGWALGLVRNETSDPATNTVWLTVVFIGLPVPTSWTVRVVEGWRTADAGASAGAWEAWGGEMGAEYPEGFKFPPASPPCDQPVFPQHGTTDGGATGAA